MDVGLELREARERRGLTLQQISAATKISLPVLRAIEACDDRRLPGLPSTVYVRSFVKNYAGEVGLDRDDTARRYLEQFAIDEGEPDTPALVPEPPAPPTFNPLHSVARLAHERLAGPAAIGVVVLAIITMAIAQRDSSSGPEPSAQPGVMAAGLAPAPRPQETPVGTSGTAADAVQLVIAPTGPCWAQATAGDTRLFAVLLQAGERRAVDAASGVTLRVGDPAACAMTINGKAARIPGPAGQATTVRVTRENYRQFVSPR